MPETGITLTAGDDLEDATGNDPVEVNDKFDTLIASILTALQNIQEGQEQVTNDAAATLAVGDLVYFSSWDSTESQRKVKKAIVTTSNTTTLYAQGVVTTGGADQATTIVVKKQTIVTGLNTNGLTVGRSVFLSTVAGGWLSTLPAANNRIQLVGTILEAHASTGRINYNLPGAIVPFGSADDV